MRIFTRSTETTKTDTLQALALVVPAVVGGIRLASAVKSASTQGAQITALQRMQQAQKEAQAARERQAYEDGVAAARKVYMAQLEDLRQKFEVEKASMAQQVAEQVMMQVIAVTAPKDAPLKVAEPIAAKVAEVAAAMQETEAKVKAGETTIANRTVTINPANLQDAAKAALARKKGVPTPRQPVAPTAQA